MTPEPITSTPILFRPNLGRRLLQSHAPVCLGQQYWCVKSAVRPDTGTDRTFTPSDQLQSPAPSLPSLVPAFPPALWRHVPDPSRRLSPCVTRTPTKTTCVPGGRPVLQRAHAQEGSEKPQRRVSTHSRCCQPICDPLWWQRCFHDMQEGKSIQPSTPSLSRSSWKRSLRTADEIVAGRSVE